MAFVCRPNDSWALQASDGGNLGSITAVCVSIEAAIRP